MAKSGTHSLILGEDDDESFVNFLRDDSMTRDLFGIKLKILQDYVGCLRNVVIGRLLGRKRMYVSCFHSDIIIISMCTFYFYILKFFV